MALSKDQVELSSGKYADIGLGLGADSGTYVALSAQQSRLQAIKDSNGTTSSNSPPPRPPSTRCAPRRRASSRR